MTNKTVLITGAAQRIGAVIVRDLHAQGMDVIIHYHNSATQAQSLAEELNADRTGSACFIQADLLDDSDRNSLIRDACNFKNRLDVLINNASSFYPTALEDATIKQWDELVGINMKAPFFLSQQAAPYLRACTGCIVNITDIHAVRPLKGHPVYSAAKAGMKMLTQALAKELGPEVRVNAVSPGAILWPQTMDDDRRKQILNKTTLKRQGCPEDVAKAVRFLINDADYMTGQVLTIDGGRTLFS